MTRSTLDPPDAASARPGRATNRAGGDRGGRGAPVTAGIDVGGTKLLGLALDAQGSVVAEARVPTPHRHRPDGSDEPAGPEAVVEAVATVADRLIGEVARDGSLGPVEAVGVGVPGLVDDEGLLHFAPNLPHAEGLHVGRLLSKHLAGMRTVVDNDATCAAVAEWTTGAARGTSNALVVTLGTGIGSGLVVGGRVARGSHGFAGEVGHMVLDPAGPPCPCGKRGCWERYASGSGLGRLAREAAQAGRLDEVVRLAGDDAEAVRGEHVSAAAAAGDPGAQAVLAELGWWLALGLANLANVLDPDRIVLGGGLIEAGDVLLEPTRAAFGVMLEASDRRPVVPIHAAATGERAGAVGAAIVARGLDRRSAGTRPAESGSGAR